MKRLLALAALLLSTAAFAASNPISCTGNSCTVVVQPRNGSGSQTTVITAGTTGVTIVNPACHATFNTSGAQGNGSTIPLTFDYDALGNCASNVFTAPSAGRYLITLTANIANVGTVVLADIPRVGLIKNASVLVAQATFPVVAINIQATTSVVLNLASSDTLSLQFLVQNGHTMTLDSSSTWSFFSVTKVQ